MIASVIDKTPTAYDYPLLLKNLLQTPLVHARQKEIVYAKSRRHDYNEFFQRVTQLANGLAKLGIEAGDTVAIMDWDSHRYLECFFAVPMIGAVLHTINVRLSLEQILYTINHAEDDIIFVHDDFVPMVDQIKHRLDRNPRFVRLTDFDRVPDDTIDFAAEYESMLAAQPNKYEFPDFDENIRATTFYTTGTTSEPKGVYFSHRQLVLHTLSVMAAVGSRAVQGRLHRDDVYMPITPMFHVHAWGIPYLATMLGTKQVYPGRYEAETLLRLIRDEGVTFSHCVPTILHMLLSHPDIAHTDLSHWKVVIGGSALPQGLARRALELGIDIYSGYGMSETCPVISLAHIDSDMLQDSMDEQLNVRCKAGLPIPMVECRIVDEHMNELPRDGVASGELVVRAPWLTQGYFKNPELSEGLWQGGYLHTGDIATIEGSGYIRITDRLKDVIKSGGEWISSLQLEDIVSRHPAVSEVAAIGVPDQKWGERPMILIAPKADHTPSEDDIKSWIGASVTRGEISKWAVPERVLFVDEIAKTSVGKIDKKSLRQEHT